MPVRVGQRASSKDPELVLSTNINPIVRAWYLTDKDGVEHRIQNQKQLQAILDQMSPEEFEAWKARVRFDPIFNGTSIKSYCGQMRDISF